jgi:hypothetical protein
MIANWRPTATLICLCFSAAAPAAEPPDAAAIMRRVASNRPPLSLALDATLTIQRRVADVYDIRIFLNGDPKQVRTVHRVTGPPEAAGLSVLMIEGGGMWLSKPGEVTPRKVEGAERATPFLGSDFTYEDLDFGFLRWPNQKFVKESRRLGFDCWVIESAPGPDTASPYSRVLSWVDKGYMAVVIAEVHDAKGKLLKSLEVKSVRKLDDKHYIVGQIALQNVQTKSRTVLRVDEDRRMEFDAALFAPETFAKTVVELPKTP